MTVSSFDTRMQRLRFRFYSRLTVHILLAGLTGFSLGLMIAAVLSRAAGFGAGIHPGIGAGSLLGTGLAAAGMLGCWLRADRSFFRALGRADRRLGLKDRLATAHEYRAADGPFVSSLLADVEACMRQHRPGEILPVTIPRYALLVPLFLLAAAVIPPPAAPPVAPAPEMASLAGRIRETARQLLGSTQSGSMERILETTRKVSMSGPGPDQALASLSGLLAQMEQAHDRALDNLAAQLNADATPEDIRVGVPGRSRSDRLDRLGQDIREAFGDDPPEAVDRALSDLEDSRDFQSFLNGMIRELGDKKAGGPGDGDRETGETDPAGSGKAPLPETSESPDPDSPPPDNASGDTGGYFAGDLPGGERQQDPKKMDTPRTEVVRDRGTGVADARFRKAVRALSARGISDLEPEAVRQTFLRRNRSARVREPVPGAYKKTVRDYFLAIGLERESP